MKLSLRSLIFLIAVSLAAFAQIPKTMSYQGVLADTSGNAVADGNYNLTFRIYDVSSGGTEIWMETQTIPVIDGVFNSILGSITPLNLTFNQPYWLSVSVDGGAELFPRIELTSAPYSLQPDSGSAGDGHSLNAADGDPVDAVYVDNDGRVGIGTINPNESLVVGDSISAMNQNVRVRSKQDVALILEADTDNMDEHDNPYISFLQDGRVVEGVIGMSGGSDIGPDGSGMTGSLGNAMVIANKRAGGAIQFMTNENSDVGSRITIVDDRVGIGTNMPNPEAGLHVQSNSLYAGYFTTDSSSSYTHVVHSEYIGTSVAANITAVYGESAAAPYYGFGGEFKGGRGGLKAHATTPGPGNRYGAYIVAGQGDGDNYGVWASAGGGTATYGVFGSAGIGGLYKYAVYAEGNLAYTGNLINASDAKLKKNIRPLTGSLNKLMQLKPRSFNFTSDAQYAHMNLPTGEHYGLIAQEVEQVLPELVSENNHPSAAESRGEKSSDPPIVYKGLNSLELIPILIGAVKEQQTIIEKQQEKIDQLEFKVNQLTNN